MSRFVEKYYPIFLSTLLIALLFLINANFYDYINFSELINSTLIVFSVLLGFLLTVSTLLHTIENDKMQIIRKGKLYPRLIDFLHKAIYSSLTIAILSLLIPLFKNQNISHIDEIKPYVKIFFMFLIFLGVFYTIRFIDIFLFIISGKKKNSG